MQLIDWASAINSPDNRPSVIQYCVNISGKIKKGMSESECHHGILQKLAFVARTVLCRQNPDPIKIKRKAE